MSAPTHRLASVAVALVLAAPLAAQAAVVADPDPPAPAASAHGSARAHFSTGELDRLLAPVALYPDSVLTQVLAAATYPLEVVEAARWSREHPDLRGEDAVNAVERKDWDPSVKALVGFPDLLARMDSDLQWTQDLGDAFLGDEGAVMDRVQVLRDRADESGHLKSVEHVRVVREREYIYLEPDVAEVVYVPYYDPLVVYGAWWWPDYPPYRWTWWAGHPAAYYSSYGGFWWGIGFRVAPSFYYCDFDWPRRQVVVINHYETTNRYYGHTPERYEGASHWQHAPEHRHGVAYRTPAQNDQWQRGYARPTSRPGSRPESRGEWRGDDRGNARTDARARDEHREARPQWDARERSNVPRTAPAEEREPRTERGERRQAPRQPPQREQPQREQPHREQAPREPQREQAEGRQQQEPAEDRPQRHEAPDHQNEGRQDDGRQRHGQRRPDRN